MEKLVISPSDRFGRLTILDRETGPGRKKWICRCDCGETVAVSASNMPKTSSCGCYNREKTASLNRSHGKSKSRLYNILKNMGQRCANAKNPNFRDYGGRGIELDRLARQSS
jgi:hypothetical protein